jgi:hypothetical protein
MTRLVILAWWPTSDVVAIFVQRWLSVGEAPVECFESYQGLTFSWESVAFSNVFGLCSATLNARRRFLIPNSQAN